MAKSADLVQGTLDLLTLKTILFEAKHGWAIAKRIQQVPGKFCNCSKARFIPRGALGVSNPRLRFIMNNAACRHTIKCGFVEPE